VRFYVFGGILGFTLFYEENLDLEFEEQLVFGFWVVVSVGVLRRGDQHCMF
jgi:hypothetical protein